jgi:hypothetical protein
MDGWGNSESSLCHELPDPMSNAGVLIWAAARLVSKQSAGLVNYDLLGVVTRPGGGRTLARIRSAVELSESAAGAAPPSLTWLRGDVV